MSTPAATHRRRASKAQTLRAARHGIIRDYARRSFCTVGEIPKRLTKIPPNPNDDIGVPILEPIVTRRQPPGFWNREHVWAKSHGFPSASQVGTCNKEAGAQNQRLCLNGTRVAQMSDALPIDLNSTAVGIGRM